MEFRLTIDVSPRLEALAKSLVFAMAAPGKVEAEASTPVTTIEETEAEPYEPAEETAEAQQAEAEAQQEAPFSAPSYPDDEELKQHMDMAISRFAGSDWRDSKDQRVLSIRKGCTKVFKEIAKWLGAEKPTSLEPEKRLEFVNRLGEILIEEQGDGRMPEVVFRPF